MKTEIDYVIKKLIESGETIARLRSALSNITDIPLYKSKSVMKEKLAYVETLSKWNNEDYEHHHNEFKNLEVDMNDYFAEILPTVKETSKMKEYNIQREKITTLYKTYKLFLKDAKDFKKFENLQAWFEKIRDTCTAHNPKDTMNWFYETIIFKPKTLDNWWAIFQKNAKEFTKFLTLVFLDLIHAYRMKSVCIAVSNPTGVEMEKLFKELAGKC